MRSSFNICKRCLCEHWLLYAIVFILAIVLIPYMVKFAIYGLSEEPKDWSYFGGYVGGALLPISIILLYMTYKEQRETNSREHFESILFRHIDTIKEKQDFHSTSITNIYDSICRPLSVPYDKNARNSKIKVPDNVLRYCYNSVISEDVNGLRIALLCEYIEYTLSHIFSYYKTHKCKIYVTELATILTDEMTTIFFYYIVANSKKDLLYECNKYGLFSKWREEDDLQKIIFNMLSKRNYVWNNCKKRKQSNEEVVPLKITASATYFDIQDYFLNK